MPPGGWAAVSSREARTSMRKLGYNVSMAVAAVVLVLALWVLAAFMGLPGRPGAMALALAAGLQRGVAAWWPVAAGMSGFLVPALLGGVALVLLGVARWLQPRELHYRVVEGQVTVPVALVERLAAAIVAEQPGLVAARVRLGYRRGAPRMTLRVQADYLSDFRKSAAELKDRLTWAITERTGLLIKDVALSVELVDRRSPPAPRPAGEPAPHRPEAAAAPAQGAPAPVEEEPVPVEEPVPAAPDYAALAEAALRDEPEPAGEAEPGGVDAEAETGAAAGAETGGTADPYYDAIDAMERAGVLREYIVGWAGGWLRNPPREPQRVTEAYQAGYEDGLARRTGAYEDWIATDRKEIA